MNLELKLDHTTPTPGQPLVLRALLNVTGSAPTDRARVPLNLVLVLDRSTSMMGEPLQRTKEAAELVLRRTWPTDPVSVVTYGSDVTTLASGARAGAGDGAGAGAPAHPGRDEAITAVRSLVVDGCTNLSGGLLRGLDLVAQHATPGSVNRIILMTDGQANQGITDPEALCALTRSATSDGISTTTVGFGPAYDEDLLRAMAEAGGGGAWYVENPEQAPGLFEEELEGLLGLAAQNVRLRLVPGDSVHFTALRHDYPQTELEGGGGVEIELGDLYALEPRLALMEFLLPGAQPGSEPGFHVEVATLELSGHVLTADGGLEKRVVRLPVTLEVGTGPRVDAEVERTHILLATAHARRAALARHGEGDQDGAVQELRGAARAIRDAGLSDAEALRETHDLETMADRIERHAAMTAADIKYMKQAAWDRGRSRGRAKDRYYRGG